MAIIKTSSLILLATFLVANVNAQSNLDLATCDDDASLSSEDGSDIGNGNARRTYEILCGKEDDGDSLDDPIIDNTDSDPSKTFNTLCTLLESGPFDTSVGSLNGGTGTIDLLSLIATGTTRHTIFAPTDAAFNKISTLVDRVNARAGTTAYDNIVSNWLQLHVLEGTYLAEDFVCDKTYNTLNVLSSVAGNQRQKTKCRGAANTFNQIGGGNVGQSNQPTVGVPAGIFPDESFPNAENNSFIRSSSEPTGASSSNIIGCNGVIHVVDEVLLPGFVDTYYTGSKGAKSYGYGGYYGYGYYGGYSKGKAGKGMKGFGFYRNLEDSETPNEENTEKAPEDSNRETDRENRKARLEALLIDANGNMEPLSGNA